MAEGVFSALVEGFSKGRELQMKKAQEAADKIYREQERQFKLQQAQAEAQQQVQENKFRTQQLEIEKAAQERLKAKDEEASAQKKRDADIREAHWGAVTAIATGKQKLDTEDKRAKFVLDKTYEYEKNGLSHEEAQARAIETMNAGLQAAQHPGLSPVQGQQQMPPMQQLLQALHTGAQQVGAQPPAVQPQQPQSNTGQSILPAIAARIQQQTEAAALSRARAEQIKMDAASQKVLIDARGALTKAQTDRIRQEVELKRQKAPLDLAKEVAEIEHLKITSQKAIADINIESARERRLQIESDIKNSPDAIAGKERKAIQVQLKSTREAKTRLNEQVMKSVRSMAGLDMAMADPKTDPVTKRSLQGLKNGYANQLADLTNLYNEANAEYLSTLKIAVQHGVTEPTTPSGGASPSAAAGNRRAVEQDAARAQRQLRQPAPHLPPPGALPATLDPRNFSIRPLPGRAAPAPPKKRDLKKKPIHQRSTQDLLKELAK